MFVCVCVCVCHSVSFQCVERVARYIEEQNRAVFEPKGIIIGDPMDRGLRCVSLMYRGHALWCCVVHLQCRVYWSHVNGAIYGHLLLMEATETMVSHLIQ